MLESDLACGWAGHVPAEGQTPVWLACATGLSTWEQWERACRQRNLRLVAASPLGLLAAGTAWGEWGAEEIQALVGFIPRAFETGLQFEAPVPDYAFPGLSEVLGYVLSAAAGTSLLLGLFALARRLWNRTAPSR